MVISLFFLPPTPHKTSPGKHIEEAIYPLIMPDGSVLPHAETATSLLGASPKVAAKKAEAIVKTLGFPNAYTLSKHLAEDLVAELHTQGRLNACIVRPSIVGANAGGPAPGKREFFMTVFFIHFVF